MAYFERSSGRVQPADDGAADDKSSEVSADPAVDGNDASVMHAVAGDLEPDNIFKELLG